MTRCCCALLAAFPVLLACDASTPGAWRNANVRDSAGVRIVENRVAIDSAVWTIEGAELTIGVVEGDPAHELRRVTGAVRLDDGRIVVANSGSAALRWFDSAGTHIRSVGRDGEGPGEFRRLDSAFRYGADSLVAYDRALFRISVFDNEGVFGRAIQLSSPGRTWSTALVTPFADGTFLIAVNPPFAPAAEQGVHRTPGAVLRLSSTGEVLDSVTSVLGAEIATGQLNGAPAVVGQVFGRSGSVSAHVDRVVVADGGPVEYEVRSSDGRLVMRVRLAVVPRPLTSAEIEAWMREREVRAAQQSNPEMLALERALLSLLQFPETYPGIAALFVDAAGNVWAEQHRLAGELYLDASEIVRRYRVFDAEGRHIGGMSLPAGTEPLEIGRDWILLRALDDLGVEYVRLHRLVRR
jgi:hypothetical protein